MYSNTFPTKCTFTLLPSQCNNKQIHAIKISLLCLHAYSYFVCYLIVHRRTFTHAYSIAH